MPSAGELLLVDDSISRGDRVALSTFGPDPRLKLLDLPLELEGLTGAHLPPPKQPRPNLARGSVTRGRCRVLRRRLRRRAEESTGVVLANVQA